MLEPFELLEPFKLFKSLELFELLFEARARYFFHFAPVIILLAAKGIRDLHKSRSIFLDEGK